MGFFSGIISAVTSPFSGGGSSSSSSNTTVNTKSEQVFSPVNNIDTDVAVDIDIDKLANIWETSSDNEILANQQIAQEQLKLEHDIAINNYKLEHDIAMFEAKQDLNKDDIDTQIKKTDLQISALKLKEQKEQNKRMTSIATVGLVVTVFSVFFMKGKK